MFGERAKMHSFGPVYGLDKSAEVVNPAEAT